MRELTLKYIEKEQALGIFQLCGLDQTGLEIRWRQVLAMPGINDNSLGQSNKNKNGLSFNYDTRDLLVAVSRVSAAISGLGNLDAILRIGLNTTLKIMNGTTGGIMLIDEDTGFLSYRVSEGFSDRYSEEVYMKLGEGIAGKVAQSGKAVLLDDILEEPAAARPDLIRLEGIRAFVSVPLKAREKVLGVMNCTSHDPCSFKQKDIYLLQSIGDQLGIAIEQARLHERLRRGRERYRQLARQVIVTQEEERKKIARDLHDETSQNLAALALNLQALIEMAEQIGIADQKFMNILKRCHASTVSTHTEVSRMIADLRPTQLDTIGLVPAVRQHVYSNLIARGVEVRFDLDDINKKLLPEEELSLFRWVQGAVGNIIQHSGAKNVEVSLRQREGNLVLRISDDGKGFDIGGLPEMREEGRGYGLLNMKERMVLIGGACSVESQPGEGTTVTAILPLAGRETVSGSKA